MDVCMYLRTRAFVLRVMPAYKKAELLRYRKKRTFLKRGGTEGLHARTKRWRNRKAKRQRDKLAGSYTCILYACVRVRSKRQQPQGKARTPQAGWFVYTCIRVQAATTRGTRCMCVYVCVCVCVCVSAYVRCDDEEQRLPARDLKPKP